VCRGAPLAAKRAADRQLQGNRSAAKHSAERFYSLRRLQKKVLRKGRKGVVFVCRGKPTQRPSIGPGGGSVERHDQEGGRRKGKDAQTFLRGRHPCSGRGAWTGNVMGVARRIKRQKRLVTPKGDELSFLAVWKLMKSLLGPGKGHDRKSAGKSTGPAHERAASGNPLYFLSEGETPVRRLRR